MPKKRKLSHSPSSSPAPFPFVPSPHPLSPSNVSADLLSVPPDPPGDPSSSAAASTTAKHGTIQPGSGDGLECGDECFLWNDLPMNKHGFRYAACASSPITSPSPLHPFYRILPSPPPCPPVHISWVDRSPFLRLSADATTCTTDRGFRAGRANIAVRQGSWYFECRILRSNGPTGSGKGSGTGDGDGNAHVRLGWGRREAQMDAPVGADGYAYGIRDVDGKKVHNSRPSPYARPFATGDVVGCHISLPPCSTNIPLLSRRRIPIRYKGQLYFEMDDIPASKEMEALVDREGKIAAARRAAALEAEAPKPKKKGQKTISAAAAYDSLMAGMRPLPTLPGSSVSFYLNGRPLSDSPAFTDLYDFQPLPPLTKTSNSNAPAVTDDGSIGYYPMISCFGRGKAQLNFGPTFAYPIPDLDVRPMSDRYAAHAAEEAELDQADELHLTGILERDIMQDKARREKAEKKLAAQAAKKAAKAEASASASARVSASATPVPMVKSGLAYEIKQEPEGDDEQEANANAEEEPKVPPSLEQLVPMVDETGGHVVEAIPLPRQMPVDVVQSAVDISKEELPTTTPSSPKPLPPTTPSSPKPLQPTTPASPTGNSRGSTNEDVEDAVRREEIRRRVEGMEDE